MPLGILLCRGQRLARFFSPGIPAVLRTCARNLLIHTIILYTWLVCITYYCILVLWIRPGSRLSGLVATPLTHPNSQSAKVAVGQVDQEHIQMLYPLEKYDIQYVKFCIYNLFPKVISTSGSCTTGPLRPPSVHFPLLLITTGTTEVVPPMTYTAHHMIHILSEGPLFDMKRSVALPCLASYSPSAPRNVHACPMYASCLRCSSASCQWGRDESRRSYASLGDRAGVHAKRRRIHQPVLPRLREQA